MDTKNERFYFWCADPIIQNFLSKQKNKSESIKQILSDVLTGELVPKDKSPEGMTKKEQLEIEYKYLRNKKLSLDIELKQRELSYWETFDKPPTPQASNAIRQGTQTMQLPQATQEQLDKVYDYMTNDLPSGSFGCNECSHVEKNKKDLILHFQYRHTNAVAALIREVFH